MEIFAILENKEIPKRNGKPSPCRDGFGKTALRPNRKQRQGESA